MRELSNRVNVKVIVDKISNSEITFYFRTPKASELIEYSAKLFVKNGDNISVDPSVRIESALEIISGIGEDNFTDEEGDVISSDPNSDRYNAEWKDLIRKYAPELLMFFAYEVFEGTYVKISSNGAVTLPLSRTSGAG